MLLVFFFIPPFWLPLSMCWSWWLVVTPDRSLQHQLGSPCCVHHCSLKQIQTGLSRVWKGYIDHESSDGALSPSCAPCRRTNGRFKIHRGALLAQYHTCKILPSWAKICGPNLLWSGAWDSRTEAGKLQSLTLQCTICQHPSNKSKNSIYLCWVDQNCSPDLSGGLEAFDEIASAHLCFV